MFENKSQMSLSVMKEGLSKDVKNIVIHEVNSAYEQSVFDDPAYDTNSLYSSNLLTSDNFILYAIEKLIRSFSSSQRPLVDSVNVSDYNP